MPTSLFVCPILQVLDSAKPIIDTPLGTLSFDANIDGVLIGDLKPSAAYHLERDGYLFRWTLDGILAELILCRPCLPDDLAVDDCWAGMWRLKVTMPVDPLEFSCVWEPGFCWMEGGPNSGQYLDAQTWEKRDQDDGLLSVTVGTMDAECLANYALHDLLPHRWTGLLGMSYSGILPDPNTDKVDPVVYLEDGFRLVFPALRAGEDCQIQFVVAWSSSLRVGDSSGNTNAWLAVDRMPEDILSGAGCH